MNKHIIVSLFHIFLVVPIFLYIAFQRAGTPIPVYHAMIAIGAIILIYHGYKAYIRMAAGSPYAWVNLIHVLFVAPLLIYIGIKGKDTPRASYEILAMVGFAALGYHLYSIVRNMMLEED
jgi:hypothetical protein